MEKGADGKCESISRRAPTATCTGRGGIGESVQQLCNDELRGGSRRGVWDEGIFPAYYEENDYRDLDAVLIGGNGAT